MVIPLNYLEEGQRAKIVWTALPDEMALSLSRWGFSAGTPVTCVRKGKGRGMSAYRIRHKTVALENGTANGILVKIL